MTDQRQLSWPLRSRLVELFGMDGAIELLDRLEHVPEHGLATTPTYEPRTVGHEPALVRSASTAVSSGLSSDEARSAVRDEFNRATVLLVSVVVSATIKRSWQNARATFPVLMRSVEAGGRNGIRTILV